MDKILFAGMAGWLLGIATVLVFALSFRTADSTLITRAIGTERAHYDINTGEIVWDDPEVRFIILGATE